MTAAPSTLADLIRMFIDLINTTIPVIGGLCLLLFLFGLMKFISSAGDAKSHEDGRKFMIWGLVAIFVMVSYVSIVYFVYKDFGFSRPFERFGPRLPE